MPLLANLREKAEARPPVEPAQPMSGPVSDMGYKKLETSSELSAVTPFAFTNDSRHDYGRNYSERIPYIQALRGLIAFEVCLWGFFRLLAPGTPCSLSHVARCDLSTPLTHPLTLCLAAIASDTDEFNVRPAPFLEHSPQWQSTVRKVFQPLLWDGSLQATFFFLIAARVGVFTFIERRNNTSIAGAAFRRPIRIFFPLAIALAFVTIMASQNAFGAAEPFANALDNTFVAPAAKWKSVLNYLDSLTAYVFDNSNAINSVPMDFFPPRGVLWTVTRNFIQSYTLYAFAILLPYVRGTPKFVFGAILWLWSWWLGNFAYYSLTGLFIAEGVVVYDLGSLGTKKLFKAIPAWTIPAFMLCIGVMLKYIFGDAFPDHRNEWVAHDNSQTGLLWTDFDPSATGYPRVDDWLVAANAMILIEMFPAARALFAANPVLLFLGRISYSLFLVEGAIFQSLGPLIWQHMVVAGHNTGSAAIVAAQFFACVPLALLVATIFHLLVEMPTDVFSRKAYIWLTADDE